MSGLDAIGETAIGELRADLVEPSLEEKLYFSNVGYVSEPTDTPANRYMAGRITKSLSMSRSILGGDGFGGRGTANVGEVVLQNGDRGLDFLDTGYDASGRPIEIFLGARNFTNGDPDFEFKDFQCVFRGRIDGWASAGKEFRLRIRDVLQRLERPISRSRYTAAEGPDLEDKPIPIALGECFNIPLVPVDIPGRVYQAHDGTFSPMREFVKVKHRAAPLTRVASSPGVGQYTEDLSAGTVTLGFNPAGGVITADVKGAVIGGVYYSTIGDLCRVVAKNLLGLTMDELADDTFSGLAKNVTATAQFWSGTEDITGIAVKERLLAGIGGFVVGSAAGRVMVGQFAAPSPSPSFLLDHTQIWDVQPVALPAAVAPALFRSRLGWGLNHRPMTDDEIATGIEVTDAERAALTKPIREAVADNSGLQLAIRGAKARARIDTALTDEGSASIFAGQDLALYDGSRKAFQFKTGLNGFGLEINMSGRITHPEIAHFVNGRDVRVFGHDPDFDAGTVTVKVYG